MRKWRPSHKCIYVISEVRGNINSLEVILNRILPLRIFENQEDILVMLGDYIDGDTGSDKVIDCLISIKNEYKDRVFFLRGDHEEMLLSSLKGDKDFNYWVENGGASTIKDYLLRSNLKESPFNIRSNRLLDIIPKSHLEFLSNLDYFKIIDDYCFFHGGFNPAFSIKDNNLFNFPFDNTSSKYVKENIKQKKEPTFLDNYIFIANNNYLGSEPFIYRKYFMLGGMAPEKLIAFELNSMGASAVTRGKSRIYKYDYIIFE